MGHALRWWLRLACSCTLQQGRDLLLQCGVVRLCCLLRRQSVLEMASDKRFQACLPWAWCLSCPIGATSAQGLTRLSNSGKQALGLLESLAAY